MIGQEAVTATLKNAIKNNQVAHAYLFCGPRGVGKTTCARILAKTLNCSSVTEDTEACQVCESCKSYNEQRSYNIHELDAASNNKVEDIRYLTDQVRIPPQLGKYSIYIIDEVHMLSSAAFNAFLKTLEEPPPHALFILATTEKHKVLPTILSRCQIFDFQRIRVVDMVDYLEDIAKQEGISCDRDGLTVVAQKAEGGMRDALSVFDQIISFSGGKVTYDQVIKSLNVLDYDYYFRVTGEMLQGNFAGCLMLLDEILKRGFDGHHFISGLASHFRDLLVCQDAVTVSLLEVGDTLRARYLEQAKLCTPGFLFQSLEICSSCDASYRTSKNQRLHVELALLKICSLQAEKKNDPELVVKQDVLPEKAAESKSLSKKTVPVEEASTPRFKGISIKKALSSRDEDPSSEAKKDSSESHESPVEKENLTTQESLPSLEMLPDVWSAIASEFSRDEPRLYQAMTRSVPSWEGNQQVVYVVTGSLQMEKMEEFRDRLLDLLRSRFNNKNISLVFRMEEPDPEDKPRLYSAEEKLSYMAGLNPVVNTLRQVFGLDFD